MQSVMTKVFLSDADNSFNTSISSDIWKEVGTAFGFSATLIAATTTIATTGANAAGQAASSGSAAIGGTKMLSTLLAVGTGIAAIVSAALFLNPVSQSGQNRAAESSSVYSDTAPVVEIMEEETSAMEPLDENSTSLPIVPEDSLIGGKLTIQIENVTLRYKIGESPTPAKIVQDAKARGFDKHGNEVELAVLEYDRIDFDMPDEYYVYLQTMGEETIRRVVIISIE